MTLTLRPNRDPCITAEVLKAGVGISGDAQKLVRDYTLGCAGLVDLASYANQRLLLAERQKWSLGGERWCNQNVLALLMRILICITQGVGFRLLGLQDKSGPSERINLASCFVSECSNDCIVHTADVRNLCCAGLIEGTIKSIMFRP